MSYLVDRYAEILTKHDVHTLYEWLQDAYGNRKRASMKLGLQRKTIYDWEKSTNEVRMLTKRKVLETNLNLDADRTISFLVKKTHESFTEILQRQMALTYRKIMDCEKPSDFRNIVTIFNRLRETYRGTLLDLDRPLMNEMIGKINKKAKLLGLTGVDESVRIVPPEYIANRLIELVSMLREKKLSKKDLLNTFDLPRDLVQSMFDAYSYLEPQSSSLEGYKVKDSLKIPRPRLNYSDPCSIRSGPPVPYTLFEKSAFGARQK